MNKNYILFFFLINLFAISNLYPTIVRTVILKQKTTGQQIALCGDWHRGLNDYKAKDASQFQYITKLIERNKENIADKVAIFYEGSQEEATINQNSLIKTCRHNLDQLRDELLCNIILAAGDTWKNFAYGIDNREDFLNLTEDNKPSDFLKIIDKLIAKITTTFSNQTAKFSDALKKSVAFDLTLLQDYRDNLCRAVQSACNCDLDGLSEENCKFKNYPSVWQTLIDRACINFRLTKDFFDLNILCEVINCKALNIAMFIGDAHVCELRDNLVRDSNYEMLYDSGIVYRGKKFQCLEFVVSMDTLEEQMKDIAPIENKDFDLMFTAWNDSKAGA